MLREHKREEIEGEGEAREGDMSVVRRRLITYRSVCIFCTLDRTVSSDVGQILPVGATQGLLPGDRPPFETAVQLAPLELHLQGCTLHKSLRCLFRRQMEVTIGGLQVVDGVGDKGWLLRLEGTSCTDLGRAGNRLVGNRPVDNSSTDMEQEGKMDMKPEVLEVVPQLAG